MAAATWTAPIDRADGYVVGGTLWNQLFGAAGDLQFLYENAWIPVASSSTAQSTTSTAAVDLLTLTPTNAIGINDWALVQFECRKQALAAQLVSFGLKVNATTVLEASATTGHTRPRSSATNQAECGFVQFLIPPRSTANYGTGLLANWGFFKVADGNPTSTILGKVAGAEGEAAAAAAIPNAAITSVTIRAINATTSNAAEVKNAVLYQLKGS